MVRKKKGGGAVHVVTSGHRQVADKREDEREVCEIDIRFLPGGSSCRRRRRRRVVVLLLFKCYFYSGQP